MSSSATVIATVPKSAAICSSAPGSATHSRPNGSRGRKCRFCQGTKARPHSAPSVMMAAGMKRSRLEFGRGVPVRPQRVRKRPATFSEGAGALAARVLEARGLVDDQHVEQRVIVGERGELADEPGHEVDADHRHLARGRGGEQLPPALGAAVEHGDAQMRQVRPGRDLLRPYGRGDELRRDDEGVPAVPVADQLGERRERGSALAGAERRDQETRRRARRGTSRRAAGSDRRTAASEGGVHRSAAFDLVYQAQTALLRLQRQACGPVRQRQHLAPQDRLRLLGARLVDLEDDLVMRRHADRHERERRVRFDAGYRQAQEVGGSGLGRCSPRSVPCHSFARPWARRNDSSWRFSPVGLPSLSRTSTSRQRGRG